MWHEIRLNRGKMAYELIEITDNGATERVIAWIDFVAAVNSGESPSCLFRRMVRGE